jgi:hypothetical protein
MENCLVKKLKATVDNSNLPIYGELKLKIKNGSFIQVVKALTVDNCEVAGDTGITFKNTTFSTDYSNPLQLTDSINNGFGVVASQDAFITFSNKYVLIPLPSDTKRFGFDGVCEIAGGIDSIIIPTDTKSFELTNSYMSLDIKDIADKLNKSNITSLEKIRISQTSVGNKLFGDISYFARTGIKNIDISGNTNISGDIQSLGSIITLENIALRDTSVSGTIESFVVAQRAAGRTTGSVSGNSAGWGLVTFNGSTTNAKGAVSWTASTITMNGVTINA